jgi:hypothetical protein
MLCTIFRLSHASKSQQVSTGESNVKRARRIAMHFDGRGQKMISS